MPVLSLVVALRKESVDRNPKLYKALAHVRWSLSARRAWIEISVLACSVGFACVALRKESVDRNLDIRYTTSPRPRSLSARRAWIEILNAETLSVSDCVALRKESVDRNKMFACIGFH